MSRRILRGKEVDKPKNFNNTLNLSRGVFYLKFKVTIYFKLLQNFFIYKISLPNDKEGPSNLCFAPTATIIKILKKMPMLHHIGVDCIILCLMAHLKCIDTFKLCSIYLQNEIDTDL